MKKLPAPARLLLALALPFLMADGGIGSCGDQAPEPCSAPAGPLTITLVHGFQMACGHPSRTGWIVDDGDTVEIVDGSDGRITDVDVWSESLADSAGHLELSLFRVSDGTLLTRTSVDSPAVCYRGNGPVASGPAFVAPAVESGAYDDGEVVRLVATLTTDDQRSTTTQRDVRLHRRTVPCAPTPILTYDPIGPLVLAQCTSREATDLTGLGNYGVFHFDGDIMTASVIYPDGPTPVAPSVCWYMPELEPSLVYPIIRVVHQADGAPTQLVGRQLSIDLGELHRAFPHLDDKFLRVEGGYY